MYGWIACDVPATLPLNGAFDEPSGKLVSYELAQGSHARIVAVEQLRRPQGFGVAPVRAVSFPTRREVLETGLLPGGVDVFPVRVGFGPQLRGILVLSQRLGGVGRAEHAAQVPQIVAHDVVLALPQVFAIRRGRRQAHRQRAPECCDAPALSTPPPGIICGYTRSRNSSVARDLIVLPQRPDGLAVRVELVRLRFEPPVVALPYQVAFDGFGGGVRKPGLLQFHHLIGPVADVELVVEVFAAVHFAVVVGDQLADVGGQAAPRWPCGTALRSSPHHRSGAASSPRSAAATSPRLPDRMPQACPGGNRCTAAAPSADSPGDSCHDHVYVYDTFLSVFTFACGAGADGRLGSDVHVRRTRFVAGVGGLEHGSSSGNSRLRSASRTPVASP